MVVNVPTLRQVIVNHFREVRSVGAVLGHAPLLVHCLADVMPFESPAARATSSDLIACGAFVIEAGVEPVVLVGQKSGLSPSHRLILHGLQLVVTGRHDGHSDMTEKLLLLPVGFSVLIHVYRDRVAVVDDGSLNHVIGRIFP